jgi:8-oxo-dGTP diphosphatase
MNTKLKVIAYIYRLQKSELLVFGHRDFPEAGIQVVGGTVEVNEDLKEALKREILEESGLNVEIAAMKKIGETEYLRKDRPEINLRHYYEIEVKGLSDSWSHTVQSDGEDDGMIFNFYWLPVEVAKKTLEGNFGELLVVE